MEMKQRHPNHSAKVMPSVEAIAVVVYKNNFEKWYEEYFEVDPRQQEAKAKQTDSGNTRKSGHSNKRHKKCFNKYYMTAIEGRYGVPGFDRDLLVHSFKIQETEDPKQNNPQ